VTAAEHTYDVVVLGAGPVEQNAAERARAGGLSVAMVERERRNAAQTGQG
jgi:pyruvate/2-oxoglutarate dehydrogenase complex dihydrolipoamide dehydrogenase (E3) component